VKEVRQVILEIMYILVLNMGQYSMLMTDLTSSLDDIIGVWVYGF
jgi:hypothetical protein